VAAARAITEAVQSRLTLIHGSRDDIVTKPVYRAETPENSRAYHYFDGLASATTWPALEARFNTQPSLDLRQSYASVLAHLRQSGHRAIIRVDLTKADFNIPVVKAIIPSLRFNRRLF
jgi:ribosomal protein S12 methylthiotransferase accessory factor